ncbi:MAG: hypothetical protein KAR38_11805 [Calditrichia bacterium]|nr:hypothetical protein [Calditrichia bacterium]
MSKRKAHGAEHFKKMVERKAMSVVKETKSVESRERTASMHVMYHSLSALRRAH